MPPIAGSPPVYTRGYSFTQHSIDQPTVPQPGDRLDAEFDDIAACIAGYSGALDQITNEDGTLAFGIVTEDQLAPGLFDQILTDAADQLDPLVQQAADSATQAGWQAGIATDAADEAGQNAQAARDAASTTANVASTALAAQHAAEAAAGTATTQASLAGNHASTADAAMQQSLAAKDLSFQWAEYMAGPVDPAPPGWPEAVDDGRWSAKWWATRAQEIVGEWGNPYLGGFHDPPPPPDGHPYVPGTIYFDLDSQTLMVWTGSQWVPAINASPSINSCFVYLAADNQQLFSGQDANGNAPTFQGSVPPSDVHVNGVRLTPPGGSGLGDYTVDVTNVAAPALHINVPLTAGSIVQWDFLLTAEDLGSGGGGGAATVNILKLHDCDLDPATGQPGKFDGVAKVFQLLYTKGDGTTASAQVTDAVRVRIVLDGATQSPGDDYTCAGGNITFAEAPLQAARFSGVWYV